LKERTEMTCPLHRSLSAALLAFTLSATAAATAQEDAIPSGGRAASVSVEARVANVDSEAREVTLQGPEGNLFTLTVPEEIGDLSKIQVGDTLRATYLAAVEAELRSPTEEELAEPWVVLQDGGKDTVDGKPVAGGARLIRAVCTIEGMNRLLGTVTILDPNENVHVISHVEPDKMQGVTLGQTLVVVFREALALELDPVNPAAAAGERS
jgi:hypothetical protein